MGKQAFNLENDMNERSKEEKNFIIKNTIFGQLLSITHNMLAFEVDKKIIEDLVIKYNKSLDSDLNEQINTHINSYEYCEKIKPKDNIPVEQNESKITETINLDKLDLYEDKNTTEVSNLNDNQNQLAIDQSKSEQGIEMKSSVGSIQAVVDNEYVFVDIQSKNVVSYTETVEPKDN